MLLKGTIRLIELDAKIVEYSKIIDGALLKYLPNENTLEAEVCRAMKYSLMAGGKRLRPILVLEFCRLCGGQIEDALPFACAIEMIHTYSLIHDDLPAMDDDDLRRGKPSNHKMFGEAVAILAGDALLNRAFEIMLSPDVTIEPQRVIKAAFELAAASGVTGMIGGQMIDLEYEEKQCKVEILKQMHLKKTGAMIIAACKIGCIVAGADNKKIEAAQNYGKNIGLSFQIQDDILDAISDSETMGKPSGSDAQNGKSTFVTVLGIEKSRELVNQYTDTAISEIVIFGEQNKYISKLAQKLSKRDR
jgi:geranylgeranyl diphosphate synthase type II